LRLLLVEDEPFIALDLEALVRAGGHEVIGVADTFEAAVSLADAEAPDAAFVDLNLRDGMTGLALARVLSGQQGVAVGFVTGNAEQLPPDFAGGVGVVDKPFTDEGVAELLGVLEHACEGRPPPLVRHARLPRR
jgi:CheY-like chemotaxis protein